LELMRLRMGGRLTYAVEAEPALRQRAFPPLLLITLVENAIKHGIEPQPGPGRVEVRASLRGDRLVVSVVDDGAGLKPGLGSGVGLSTVREQLATRFGGAATSACAASPVAAAPSRKSRCRRPGPAREPRHRDRRRGRGAAA